MRRQTKTAREATDQEIDKLDKAVAIAAVRGRKQLQAEIEAEWTTKAAINFVGFEFGKAWCRVYEAEPSWALYCEVTPWFASPLSECDLLLSNIEVLLGGASLGRIEKAVGWSLKAGPNNDKKTLELTLAKSAAEHIRTKAQQGCVWIHVHFDRTLRFGTRLPVEGDFTKLLPLEVSK